MFSARCLRALLLRPRLAACATAVSAGAAAAATASPSHALESDNDRWFREWLEQEVAEHPPAMSKDTWTPLKVWSVIPQSDNCNLVRFVFDNHFASAGMEVASYLLTRAPIGKEKADGTRANVIRPYTPSHTTIGYLELVVKCYPEGKMSTHINSLQKGDTLDFKGPITGVPITQNEFDSIGLIAGGSGITPMLQVAQRVLANPDDQTNVSLIFANVSEDDVILREKIDELQSEHPDQLRVLFVLDDPPPNWRGGRGYINKAMVRAAAFPEVTRGIPSRSPPVVCYVSRGGAGARVHAGPAARHAVQGAAMRPSRHGQTLGGRAPLQKGPGRAWGRAAGSGLRCVAGLQILILPLPVAVSGVS